MDNKRFKNRFTGDQVVVVGVYRTADGVDYIEYEKTIPVRVGAQTISRFSKPRYVFNKAYSPCNN